MSKMDANDVHTIQKVWAKYGLLPVIVTAINFELAQTEMDAEKRTMDKARKIMKIKQDYIYLLDKRKR